MQNLPAGAQRIRAGEIAALLAPTVGLERSHEVVADAMRALGFHDDPLEAKNALLVLERLGEQKGIVGVTARFAKERLQKAVTPSVFPERMTPLSDRPHGFSSQPPRHDSKRPPSARVVVGELVNLLVPTLGSEKSEEVVRHAMRYLGMFTSDVDAAQAMQILELLATMEGIIGVTARFAKARLILKFR